MGFFAYDEPSTPRTPLYLALCGLIRTGCEPLHEPRLVSEKATQSKMRITI
jgi:hypothetical protein